ncbi:mediator of RNA polymerase II transcription subunit 15a-like [Lolium rigidum]|uniref:mediator of RNA polymerase II transcription subunit 15a-like n=1 Tax=Lolium rigidum TaxID=89674 RepID=UPI001F5DF577|nr:mediator of RNA polymerase II transcription subunit 15a-like [Lolium rigidum]
MLSMETMPEQAPGNSQNNPGQESVDNSAQTGQAGVGNWQEEIYQMIRSLKEKYFAELNELFNKISVKIHYVDSIIPPQRPSEQYERMKNFKIMLERILQILQISKSTLQPALRDKLPHYEKQIISILNSQRRKPVQPQVQQQFQPPAGQASNSNISQQRQPSESSQKYYSHTNPQASLSTMSTGLQSSNASCIQHPTTKLSVPMHQNGAKRQRQTDSDLKAARRKAAQRSSFDSVRYGSIFDEWRLITAGEHWADAAYSTADFGR